MTFLKVHRDYRVIFMRINDNRGYGTFLSRCNCEWRQIFYIGTNLC